MHIKGLHFCYKNLYDLSYTKTEICSGNNLQNKPPCEIFPKTYNYRYLPLFFYWQKMYFSFSKLATNVLKRYCFSSSFTGQVKHAIYNLQVHGSKILFLIFALRIKTFVLDKSIFRIVFRCQKFCARQTLNVTMIAKFGLSRICVD